MKGETEREYMFKREQGFSSMEKASKETERQGSKMRTWRADLFFGTTGNLERIEWFWKDEKLLANEWSMAFAYMLLEETERSLQGCKEFPPKDYVSVPEGPVNSMKSEYLWSLQKWNLDKLIPLSNFQVTTLMTTFHMCQHCPERFRQSLI